MLYTEVAFVKAWFTATATNVVSILDSDLHESAETACSLRVPKAVIADFIRAHRHRGRRAAVERRARRARRQPRRAQSWIKHAARLCTID
eukprot:5226438-Pleurochrysis_carterae.AAC.2